MRRFVSLAVVFIVSVLAAAQEQPNPPTLIPQKTLNEIAAQVSGAQAYNHVVDMCGYERVRPADEYRGTYREAEYAERKAKEYGYADAHIERFPLPNNQKQWAGEVGELWIELEPEKNRPLSAPDERTRILVTRYRDLPATLATGSRSADVTADLVYIGRGDSEQDYAGKDVKGKIVLVSGPIGAAHNLAVRRFGAEGVVSFNDPTGKPIDRPDQIAWNGITGGGGAAAAAQQRAQTQRPGEEPSPQTQQTPQQPAAQQRTTWGFNLSHRMGMELLALLEQHRAVKTHAIVKAAEYDAPMQVVVATIPGDGSTDQEVVFVAHLFEGVAKQGANDNCSGPATQLEAGRAWISMVNAGTLPKPKRTVRFLWVPEIQGSRAYLNAHPEHAAHVLAAVDMDMVGADQSKNHNSLHLNTTPASMPSFLNTVTQQMIEYVGDTNREKLANRRVAYAFADPIIDPKGSHDPFWYHVEKFYGSSDHQVYLDAAPRVPSIQYGNWPDAVYHTSEDTPMFLDPTQMKRAAFLTVTTGTILANAGPREANEIAGLTLAYGQERIAREMLDATGRIAASQNAQQLATNYKEARNVITQAYIRENEAVASARSIMPKDYRFPLATIAPLQKTLSTSRDLDFNRLQSIAEGVATAMQAPLQNLPLTAEEQAAAKLYPQPKPGTPRQPQGFGGGGQQQQQNQPLSGYYVMEARNFADGQHSLLAIRNALSAEFAPVPLANVEQFFHDLEKQGWEIVEKAPEPAAKPTKKK